MSEKQYTKCDADGRELPADATDYAIVYDPATNLEWFADVLPDELQHRDTDKACADQTLAGGGWRMADYHESTSIVDVTRFKPARNPVFRGPNSGWMWTSSLGPSAPEDFAFIVYLCHGYVHLHYRYYTAWVRPCRARRAPSQ